MTCYQPHWGKANRNKLELQIPHQMQETSDEEKDCGAETRVLKVDLVHT